MLDDPREIYPTMPRRIERLVDFLRVFSQRRGGAGSLGRILRQREVLHHQGRGKARLVFIIGR